MDLKIITDPTLRSLHAALRAAVIADDAAPADAKPYGCRIYPDWKEQADQFEGELRARRVAFDAIDW